MNEKIKNYKAQILEELYRSGGVSNLGSKCHRSSSYKDRSWR